MTEKEKEVLPQTVWQGIARMTEILAKEGIDKKSAEKKAGGNTIDYKFRGIDDIRNTTAPLMKECNIVIIPNVMKRVETERQTKNGGFALWVVLEINFDVVCTVDGSKVTIPMIAEAVDYSDKATGKAISYAYKTLCINLFNIPTVGEDDTDEEKVQIAGKRVGVFTNDEERDRYKTNCLMAFEDAENALKLKEIEGFYHEKLILMSNSQDKADQAAAADIRAAYTQKINSFKAGKL